MTPTNLPDESPAFMLPDAKDPRDRAAVIGTYEGGAYHDCGVFRPAGRCNMRGSLEQVLPFCHVCRYIIVDRVDPTKHGKLDALYEKEYPRPAGPRSRHVSRRDRG